MWWLHATKVIQLIGWALLTQWCIGLLKPGTFPATENLTILATGNLTISDRLQETGYNSQEGLSNF